MVKLLAKGSEKSYLMSAHCKRAVCIRMGEENDFRVSAGQNILKSHELKRTWTALYLE
jgi:hypothetical protein